VVDVRRGGRNENSTGGVRARGERVGAVIDAASESGIGNIVCMVMYVDLQYRLTKDGEEMD
jgi:hypothetical protein